MKNIGIPENAVDVIMKLHGEVYGMVPREVWGDEWKFPVPNESWFPAYESRYAEERIERVKYYIRPGNWWIDYDSRVDIDD